jgi:hypothetical protein
MRLLQFGLPCSIFAAALGATACSGTTSIELRDTDASTDGGAPESGPADTGTADVADGSISDTGAADTGLGDTGVVDDGSRPDATPGEAGPDDAGLLDAQSDARADAEVDAGPLVCTAPAADCDDSGTCETDTKSSLQNCGACGHTCAAENAATPKCVDGSCAYVCVPGYLDCNGQAQDGCECEPAPNSTVSCAGTSCVVHCNPGFDTCDGSSAPDCATPTGFDNANCGGCGITCPSGTSCGGGVCLAPSTVVAPAEANGVTTLGVDGTAVYWTTNPSAFGTCDAAFRSAPSAGGTPTTIATGLCSAGSLAFDATSVYVATQTTFGGDGVILSYPKASAGDAGAAAAVATFPGDDPYEIVLQSGTFYALAETATAYGIFTTTPGSAPVQIAPIQNSAPAFALTPSAVVFLEGYVGLPVEVHAASLTGDADGGADTLLATLSTTAQDIAYLQGNVYVADSDHLTVLQATASPSPSAILLPSGVSSSHVLAANGNIYFSTQPGSFSYEPGLVAVLKNGGSSITPLAVSTGVPPEGGVDTYSDVPIAADSSFIYFGDGSGIHRVAL